MADQRAVRLHEALHLDVSNAPKDFRMRRPLTTSELRQTKVGPDEFLARPRRPITVILDGVTRNYNIGAIFRLCDAFLVERLRSPMPP